MSAWKAGKNGLALSLLLTVLAGAIALGGAGYSGPAAAALTAGVVAEATPAGSRAPTPGETAAPQAVARPTATVTADKVSVGSVPTPGPAAPTPGPVASPIPVPTTLPTSTAAIAPSAGPAVTAGAGITIGVSVQGRPIVAYRMGAGPIKVALVADIHGDYERNTHELAQQLLAYFQAHPQVPDNVSLWIVPTMNPDGLASGSRFNAHGVDLNRNADTDLDGCAGNDWSHDTRDLQGAQPGGGGAYPFSEPETRAVRDFLADAWVAVFYHSAGQAVYGDTCALHKPTAQLAAILSGATGYPVPPEGWLGYPVTGELGDYLAGEGVAAVSVELSDHESPEFDRNLAGVQALVVAAGAIVNAEATAAGAEPVWLTTGGREANTGTWQYSPGTFVHPQAIDVVSQTAYLLDGGRVLALDLANPAAPRLLLSPGDTVSSAGQAGVPAGVRVLELLDLAADGGGLLALDRAGDVYRYDIAGGTWAVERYDRPSGTTSDHYYVALAAAQAGRFMLEASHDRIWRFAGRNRGAAWAGIPGGRDVDLAATGGDVYLLTRNMNNPLANLSRYHEVRASSGFKPGLALIHPRQVQATGQAVLVLDRGGRRLLDLDPAGGRLRRLYQFSDRRAAGAAWSGPDGELILAGRDALYFYGRPDRQATIEGGPAVDVARSYDPAVLDRLRGLAMPIQGAHITARDFQIPGAPRHYRLGVHEGTDFYGYAVGVQVDRSTPVHAVAEGVVIRADLDYKPLTAALADAWAAECRKLGYTPDDLLDSYRGRQVWIQHDGGLVSRYAHLSAIAPDIRVGTAVSRGQVIGAVGNSGTPDGLAGPDVGLHLHLELWLGETYVGQFMRPLETREWLERILR